MNGLALCAGIGGLELGLKLALGDGYRCVGYVEREAFAASVLVARMEDAALDRAPIWGDLSTFDGRPWRGRVDLISAGYPCQPFSVAGRRGGESDPRHLWPHVRRIIEEVGPSLVFLENVPGHLSLGFDAVLGDLAGLGFDAEWCVLGAADVGAPHRRKRLWCLAYRDPDGRELLGRSGILDEERAACGRDADGSGGAPVADSSLLGEREPHHEASADARNDARPSAGGRSVWPPPPNDLHAWRGVQADAESRVRDVVNGLSAFLDGGLNESNDVPPTSEEVLARCLRALRGDGGTSSSPPGHRHHEQRPEEHRDGVQAVSHPGPLGREAGRAGCREIVRVLWRGNYEEAAQRIVAAPQGLLDPALLLEALLNYGSLQPSVCRVSADVPDRVDRLRALGNGVVPLAAAHAFRVLAARACERMEEVRCA